MEELIILRDELNETLGVQMQSKRRTEEYAFARFTYVKIARDLFGAKLKQIGQSINRDHSTIVHAYKSSEYMPDKYKKLVEVMTHKMNMTQGDVVGYMTKMIDDLQRELNDIKSSKEYDVLTDNEKIYRTLTDDQRREYDFRVTTMLKMFVR